MLLSSHSDKYMRSEKGVKFMLTHSFKGVSFYSSGCLVSGSWLRQFIMVEGCIQAVSSQEEEVDG